MKNILQKRVNALKTECSSFHIIVLQVFKMYIFNFLFIIIFIISNQAIFLLPTPFWKIIRNYVIHPK